MLTRVWTHLTPHVLRIRRRAVVAVIGDSNTLISYLPPWSRERWSAIVAARTGRTVLNLGRNGATLRQAIDAGDLDRALRASPRDLVVAFAVNDSTRETPEAFAELLQHVCQRAQAAGIRPWLMTGVWLDYPEHYSTNRRNEEIGPFNDLIRRVAEEESAGLIDVAARLQAEAAAGNWDVRIRNGAIDDSRDAGRTVESKWWNNVHLNVNGCRVVADEVERVLAAGR